jgi:PAS domain S-box-containing protein
MTTTSTGADARTGSEILVVDDDDDAVWLITALLADAGHKVRPARNGALALLTARAAPPALILLDIRLPGIDGFEVCRRLKAEPRTADVPVIFLSALHEDNEKGSAFRAGGVDYITKPIHKEELLARVGTHLAIVRAQRELASARDAAQKATRAEHAAVRSLRATLYGIGDGVIATDARARVQIMNPVAETLTGWTEAEARGRRVTEVFRIVHEDTRAPVECTVESVLRDGRTVAMANHTVLIARDGIERPIADSGAPVRDDAMMLSGAVLVFRDQTDARHAEHELLRLNAEYQSLIAVLEKERLDRERLQSGLIQADRLASMGMLAAGVAHEINNPLSYVLFHLETLTEDLPMLATLTKHCRADLREDHGHAPPAALAELLEPAWLDDVVSRAAEALDGVRRIRKVVSGLGTFSRVERVELSNVDVAVALDSALCMAFNEIKYRAQLIKDLGQVPSVWASEGKLAQVFLNLLVNAAQSVEEGNVDGNRITVRTWAEAESVCVEVADTGAGIPPESLARVFEPFFTSKGVGKGSGLGLPICRNLVAEFGGEIGIESAVGEGTRVTVRLPRVPCHAAAPPPTKVSEAPAAIDVRGRLLVVDDEPAIRAAMKRLLGRAHEVVTAASGAEARSILEQDTSFDVILCDLMMPDMTGMELHAWLTVRDPNLAAKIVFVTGGAFTPRSSEYVARSGNARIEKPFDAAALRTLVAEFVAANHARAKDPMPLQSQPPKSGGRQ